eukprot:scaffold33728_cov101-Isochrysis_galbana.AAC.1
MAVARYRPARSGHACSRPPGQTFRRARSPRECQTPRARAPRRPASPRRAGSTRSTERGPGVPEGAGSGACAAEGWPVIPPPHLAPLIQTKSHKSKKGRHPHRSAQSHVRSRCVPPISFKPASMLVARARDPSQATGRCAGIRG